jgi:integral membrane sensor domain MASE1
VWPASGFALAAFLLLGGPIWPAVLSAAFLVHFAASGSILASIVVAGGSTLEGLVAAALIRRYAAGQQAFLKAETIFRFAALLAIATAIGASAGSLAEFIAEGRQFADLPLVWMTWWLGHVTGAMVLAPMILLWASPSPGRMRILEVAEAMGLLILLVVVGLVVFGGRYPSDVKDYPLEFLCVPFFLDARSRPRWRS